MHPQYFSVLAFFATGAFSFAIPGNLANLRANHLGGKCANNYQGGFSPNDDNSGDTSFCYCGDIANAVYLHSQHGGGQYADMDIDCDGAKPCPNDPSGLGITAFQDTVNGYNKGKPSHINDLDANIHPYVVFGNEGSTPSYTPAALKSKGVLPLSVMAVVCNGNLHYGIWGDTNGGTLVGEASISLAKLCFPNDQIDGNHGHSAFDVMYIAFKNGTLDANNNPINTVPGASGATWNAGSASQFESSIKALGDRLVAALPNA